jgi:cytochrome c-type biogenesis protein CcmH
MLLWTVLALMTGAAALAALWPLAHGAVRSGEASDVDIYRDQLAELDRDLDRGVIAGPEAEAARVEVARRLIAAGRRVDTAAAAAGGAATRRRVAAAAILIVVPILSLGLYTAFGSPGLPDLPLQARLDAAPETQSLDELVARVEQRLATAPDDGKGWEVLAPIYLRAGRADDAKNAYRQAIRLLGSTPQRQSGLGEAAMLAANGVVTAEARQAFEKAAALDPADPKARYYLGRAKEQDGDTAAALADWRAVRGSVAAGTPVAQFLDREIARLDPEARPPRPDAEAMAAADTMSPDQRQAMIRGMVEGLAARLKSGGGSEEEWLRLVRAWSVLGERDKAVAAASDARRALAASPASLKALDDLTRSLGLPG